MAAVFPTFVSAFTAYLQSNSAKKESDTAKKVISHWKTKFAMLP